MARSARLLALMQQLRRHRRPVTAATLADAMEVSVRTVYRDIATLVSQGAPIAGEAGLGYVLRPGFFLPPLMLRDEEIEAVTLGLRWVVERGDPALAEAARESLAKIAATLPEDLKDLAETAGLYAVAGPEPAQQIDLAIVRRAVREERKLEIVYADGEGTGTRRVIWPLALALFDGSRMVPAWCEVRGDFRNFRTDRIADAILGGRYPIRRRVLLDRFREHDGAPDDTY